MLRKSVAPALCFLLVAWSLAADDECDKLIDELAQVSEPGVGYSAYFSGSSFLPYADSGQLGTFVLGATHRSESDTLRQLVAKGADAIPALLKHLADEKKIKLEPLTGMMWMDFPDEYDFNARTQETAPPNVNRRGFNRGEHQPNSHAITIGDLCFVAIGQIVNRNYAAARYQPTGGLVVNSPTYSKRLRDVLLTDWSDLTAEKHRRLLIDDLEKPDHGRRQIGAYQRLCFYYPDSVEALVLKVLEQPTFDAFKIHEFCRELLYHAKPEERKQLYEEFIRQHGSQYSIGVMEQLFNDLATLEAHEKKRISPPLTAYSTQPRELLIQLFDKPDTIKSLDRPPVTVMSDSERARFIGSLTHDESKRVGDLVKQIFLKRSHDKYLAPACLRCLANRGFDEFLVEQFNSLEDSKRDVDDLHRVYLKAIATSTSQLVKQRLLQVIKETTDDTCFIHALSGLEDIDDQVVWENTTRILRSHPDDSKRGGAILEQFFKRFPHKAEESCRSFLSTVSVQRAETMCVNLEYDHPLSAKILAPLLDDQRELGGFTTRMRVCDRAAQAICHTIKEIRFNTDWSQEQKDAAIIKLKAYCESRK